MITNRQIEQLREVIEKFKLNDNSTFDFIFGINWLNNVPSSECLDKILSECSIITELLRKYDTCHISFLMDGIIAGVDIREYADPNLDISEVTKNSHILVKKQKMESDSKA